MPNYKLRNLKIPVTDVQRSAEFYAKTLGFTSVYTSVPFHFAQMKIGDIIVNLFKPDQGNRSSGLAIGNTPVGKTISFQLALPATEFKPLADTLKTLGVLEGNKIHEADDGSTFIEVKDPDGNVLYVGKSE